MRNLTHFNLGDISVVCLGPLTNIALAIKLYPEFLDNVKEFFVMGGNSTGDFELIRQAYFGLFV